jgi:predicted dehydrogenase
MRSRKVPVVLLVGLGRFGQKHLTSLKILEKRGLLQILGAVVTSNKSRDVLKNKFNIEIWNGITTELLKKVDAVDIVTPPETHMEIALQCLPYTHIFLEKPMALLKKDAQKIDVLAKKYNHKVMIGHIFRFDPVIKKLKLLISQIENTPLTIRGKFINPISNDVGKKIPFEMIHLFDSMDFLFPALKPKIIYSLNSERTDTTSIQYSKNIHAEFEIGWKGEDKIRKLEIHSSIKKFLCNFEEKYIKIIDLKNNTSKIIPCHSIEDPLTKELICFLDILKGKNVPYPNAEIGIKLVEIAERVEMSKKTKKASRPKVAIIGGGIFGTNCAIELGTFCDVTIFEKNEDIMQEASFVNQYRHHWGYHYPRSSETVKDIGNAIVDFENLYEKAIIRNFPTYYFIAKNKSKISTKEYIKFCEKHNLPFTLENPEKGFVDETKINLSMKTLEPIYNYKKLKNLVESYLKKSSHIKLELHSEVIHGKIENNSMKTLTYKNQNGTTSKESFDYVINATYSKYNQFNKWFNFPIKPVRIDLVEALIIKLPIPKISLAIMDGPFTNLVPTDEDHLFTLVHIKESILERYVPITGLPKTKKPSFTRIKETLKESAKWFPILHKAELVETRYVFRAVNAHREHDDARPSDLTYYGFGCWSILGGKIINSVTTAKNIAREIKSS